MPMLATKSFPSPYSKEYRIQVWYGMLTVNGRISFSLACQDFKISINCSYLVIYHNLITLHIHH